MTDLGNKIKEIRGKQSRAEFAKKHNIHPNTLQRWENGERQPDLAFLQNLVTEYKLSPEWLFFGTDSTRPDSFREKDQLPANTSLNECSRCAKLEHELELEKEERRELAVETRRLYREKEQLLREKEELLRENGTLREKVARLEADQGKQRADKDGEGDFSTQFDERRSITSSSRFRTSQSSSSA